MRDLWPAPGSEDTELGVLMEPEVGVVRVQAAKKAPSLEAPTAWEGQHVALARAAADAKPFLRAE